MAQRLWDYNMERKREIGVQEGVIYAVRSRNRYNPSHNSYVVCLDFRISAYTPIFRKELYLF